MVAVRAQGEEGLYHRSASAKASVTYPKRQVQSQHIFTDSSDRAGWPTDKWSPLSGEASLLCSVQDWSGGGLLLLS